MQNPVSIALLNELTANDNYQRNGGTIIGMSFHR